MTPIQQPNRAPHHCEQSATTSHFTTGWEALVTVALPPCNQLRSYTG